MLQDGIRKSKEWFAKEVIEANQTQFAYQANHSARTQFHDEVRTKGVCLWSSSWSVFVS